MAASTTSNSPPFSFAGPLTALALIVSVGCWLTVISRWRALPKHGDDDQGWWRRGGEDAPTGPGGGGGGLRVDWPAFERQFWAYVAERESTARLAGIT